MTTPRTHLFDLPAGATFRLKNTPKAPYFTIVECVARNHSGAEVVVMKARDSAGVDHSLTEMFIGNKHSYFVVTEPRQEATP